MKPSQFTKQQKNAQSQSRRLSGLRSFSWEDFGDRGILDDLISFQSKKATRQSSRYYRKFVKKLQEKIESGFYDCTD